MLNGLDLFSGIGGISYALQDYVTTRAYCEIDRYARGVLLSRMESGDIDNAPIWNDVKTFPTKQLAGRIDIITGGFPCTDISVAGKGAGIQGARSGLFFEIVRLAEVLQPKYIFLENVPLITKRGGVEVVRTLAESGYNCVWTTLSAQAVGALHKRERWFLLAEKSRVGDSEHFGWDGASVIGSDGTSMQDSQTRQNEASKSKGTGSRGQIQECVWDAQSKRVQGLWAGGQQEPSTHAQEGLPLRSSKRRQWEAIASVCRMSDGLPFELDLFKQAGEVIEEKGNSKKSNTTLSISQWKILRAVWKYREIAETSPDLYARNIFNSVPEVPHRDSCFGGNLGKRLKTDERLCNMLKAISSASFEKAQNMQPRVQERFIEIERIQKMEKRDRIDRIKCLGNSVVPLQVSVAFEYLMALSSSLSESLT
jgi:DNA (cytosine-5)-methyltransferase 1